MENHSKKIAWQKPKILFELPFKKTAAGLPGYGEDGSTYAENQS